MQEKYKETSVGSVRKAMEILHKST